MTVTELFCPWWPQRNENKIKCNDEENVEGLLSSKDGTFGIISQNHEAVKAIYINDNASVDQSSLAMNTPVGPFTPKGKHYCETTSLLTRADIAAGCQVHDHSKFWSIVCNKFGFGLDPNLSSLLA